MRDTILVKSANGVSLAGKTVSGHQFHHCCKPLELGHFVLGVGEDQVRVPRKIFRADVAGGERELYSVRFHRSYVGVLIDSATYSLRGDYTDQVVIVTLIPVGGEIDAVFEYSEVNADIQLMLFLIGQLTVLDVLNHKSRLLDIGEGTIGREATDDGLRVGHFRRTTIGGKGVRGFQRQIGEGGLQCLEERLLVHVPCTGQVPRGQPTR